MPTNPIDYYMDAAQAAPAVDGVTIAFSDSVAIPTAVRGIYCSAAGTVTIVTPRGSVLQFTVVAGGYIPFWAVRVNLTGTSVAAGSLIGAI